MILYHGSDSIIEHFDISHSRKKLDFGIGFYLTSIKDQAIKWADQFKSESNKGYVNSY